MFIRWKWLHFIPLKTLNSSTATSSTKYSFSVDTAVVLLFFIFPDTFSFLLSESSLEERICNKLMWIVPFSWVHLIWEVFSKLKFQDPCSKTTSKDSSLDFQWKNNILKAGKPLCVLKCLSEEFLLYAVLNSEVEINHKIRKSFHLSLLSNQFVLLDVDVFLLHLWN